MIYLPSACTAEQQVTSWTADLRPFPLPHPSTLRCPWGYLGQVNWPRPAPSPPPSTALAEPASCAGLLHVAASIQVYMCYIACSLLSQRKDFPFNLFREQSLEKWLWWTPRARAGQTGLGPTLAPLPMPLEAHLRKILAPLWLPISLLGQPMVLFCHPSRGWFT